MVIDIQTGALVVAGATLVGAAVGAVVPEYWRSRVNRRNLRVALKAEMEQMNMLDGLEPSNLPEPAETEIVPTTIFDENAGSIGLLTEEEVTKVTRFYSTVFWFQRELRIWEAAGDDKRKLGEHVLDTIKDQRSNAIATIERNL